MSATAAQRRGAVVIMRSQRAEQAYVDFRRHQQAEEARPEAELAAAQVDIAEIS